MEDEICEGEGVCGIMLNGSGTDWAEGSLLVSMVLATGLVGFLLRLAERPRRWKWRGRGEGVGIRPGGQFGVCLEGLIAGRLATDGWH